MVNVAVVGCGRWGANYVRVLEEMPDARVEWVFDADEEASKRLVSRFTTVKAAKRLSEITSSKEVDAVVVATPAALHYEVACSCLEAGKHVLVEKPVTLRVVEAAEMMALAETRNRILMVGHTFLFNPGVRALKGLLEDPAFGKVYYLHATRTNMGPIRTDVDALWDLAPHDVSIFNYLLGTMPDWVSATGTNLFGNGRSDVGFVTLGYPDGVLANIHVSWADPYKVREVVAVGSKRRVVFNDLDSLETVRVFEKSVMPDAKAESFGEFKLLMRDGDILSPRIQNAEPLKVQCSHFIECVRDNRPPVSDAATGLEVVSVMSAISESVRQKGSPVAISPLGV